MNGKEIQKLTDYQAIRIVGLIGEAHEGEVPTRTERADLIRVLARTFDMENTPCPSDGQAATAALELLAKDHRFAGPVEAMVNGPHATSMSPGTMESAYLIAGLLVALQTQFEFERDKDGRWSVKIKKQSTSDALLKPLIKKLTDLLGVSGQ